MNIYEVSQIEKAIEESVDPETGEIDEELVKDLIHAQTRSIEQVEKLCKYVKHLENFVSNAKEEKARINDLQKKAENRMASVKSYMLPYIQEIHGGKFDAGTFKVSTRKSESVELVENFNDADYCETRIELKPDKKKIKEAIKNGLDIPGAKLIEKTNLQIK